MHPVALMASRGEDVPDGAPEAQSSVSYGQLRGSHPALLQISQQLRLTLGGLPVAVLLVATNSFLPSSLAPTITRQHSRSSPPSLTPVWMPSTHT